MLARTGRRRVTACDPAGGSRRQPDPRTRSRPPPPATTGQPTPIPQPASLTTVQSLPDWLVGMVAVP
ncbi:hypothetical protein GCM10010495_46370 [Kitasatospora herbaricolor]|nr:hypothetical protein GCM10010495_46370 [Kitasatospora herbaricolor]